MQRLEGSPLYHKHLCYERAGHMILHPDSPVITEPFKHPVTGLFYEVGGEPAAQSVACKDSWKETLLFLSRDLAGL